VTAPVGPFSGGEKARLALALIIWSRPNLLLLDEPTNHLDLETREVLTSALAQFEGTVIVVAHDRSLLRASADQFLLVTHGRLENFEGDLDDYRDWLLGKTPVVATLAAAPESAPSKSALPEAAPVPVVQRATDAARRDQKRRDAEQRNALAEKRRPIESRIKRIEDQLGKLNAKRTAMESALAADGVYEAGQKESLRQLLLDQAYVLREIQKLEEEWLEQHTALEQVAA